MTVTIDIEKKLPGFLLKANMEFGNEIIGILGASGSGKTMLLNSIAGLVRPDKGKILQDGRVSYDYLKKINLPPRERKVGYLFQRYALFPHMTVAENIAFGLTSPDSGEKEKKIAELLDRFHIGEIRNRYPSQISGGQQQRAALARAMASDPGILLLDEPFSALDSYLKNHMMKEMKAYLKDFPGTTLLVTHNIEEAYRLCDKILVMNRGKAEAFGQRDEIFQNPPTRETAVITGCKNITPVVLKSTGKAELAQWGIEVESGEEGFAGIRANHIKLATEDKKENCYPAWIVDEHPSTFRTSLYLKIGGVPSNSLDYHLQWEISKEERELLRDKPQPLNIFLDPAHLFYMAD